MTNEFATVLTSWSVEEIHLAKIHLADENINAHVADELIVGTLWNHANAIRGVKLLVKSEDEVQARAILHRRQSSAPEFIEEVQDPSETGESESTDDEDEHGNGALSAMRSIKTPVILLFLVPAFLVLLMFVTIILGMFLAPILKRTGLIP